MLNLFIETIERIRETSPAKQKEFIESSPNSLLVMLLTDLRTTMDETMNEFVQQKKSISLPSIGSLVITTNKAKVKAEISRMLDEHGVDDINDLSDEDKVLFDKELYHVKADIVEKSKNKNEILTIKLQ